MLRLLPCLALALSGAVMVPAREAASDPAAPRPTVMVFSDAARRGGLSNLGAAVDHPPARRDAARSATQPGWGFVLGGTLLGGLAGLVLGFALGRLTALARPPSSPGRTPPASVQKPRAWHASGSPPSAAGTQPVADAAAEPPPQHDVPPPPAKKRAWEQ